MRWVTDIEDARDSGEEDAAIAAAAADEAMALDSELQAAIEYKIALSGIEGVEQILHYVKLALSRHTFR
jgi:hypothetical protein